MPPLLEICCGSLDDAIEAERGGADRVELCSALYLGGLTPSIGTVLQARASLRIPFIAMVRPRAGGFCYTDAEFLAMEPDAERMLAAGADGIVFGILNANGTIDVERSRHIVGLAGGRQTVFHRAFDVVPDPFAALETLINLGVTRILTSGQRPTVGEGATLIKQLIERAAGRIEILPGGGIPPADVRHAVAQTGASQIHLTAFRTAYDRSGAARPDMTFGGAAPPIEGQYEVTDAALVRRIKTELVA